MSRSRALEDKQTSPLASDRLLRATFPFGATVLASQYLWVLLTEEEVVGWSPSWEEVVEEVEGCSPAEEEAVVVCRYPWCYRSVVSG